jgi:hypothetical protein
VTTNPQTLTDLMAYWTSHGGVNLGIKGDPAHQSRGSYHNGFDVASKLWGTTSLATIASKDYSYRLARDRVKSNAAAALDLGRLNGSLANLQRFSRWLVAQAQANPTKYRDIREIIYSPDGRVVKRWSGPDNRIYNVALDNAVARGHLTHTHISTYRDSERRDKRALFAGYFTIATAGGPPMPALTSYIPGQVATIKPTANIRSEPKLTATILRVVKVNEPWTVTGWVKGDVDAGSDQWLVRWNGRWEYTAKSNVIDGPKMPAGGDAAAAVRAATTPLQATIEAQAATIAGLKNDVVNAATKERTRVADAEAARIRAT